MDLLIPPGQQDAYAALADPLNFPTQFMGWLDDRIKLVGGRSATAATTTVSAMSGGPPATAADGDIWFATGVDANGTRWMFQYNASSGSSFKWEFVGGPPLYGTVTTQETTTSVSFTDLATVGPSVALVRGGDWIIRYGAVINASASGFIAYMSYALSGGSSAAAATPGAQVSAQNGSMSASVAVTETRTGLLAGTTVTAKYEVSAGTGTYAARFVEAVPIRVS